MTTSLDRVAEVDPVFGQMLEASTAHARATPELTDREKTFLSVVADLCQSTLGLPFEAHLRAGLRAGVSTSDVRALLRFISYDCGYHAAVEALFRLADFERAEGLVRQDVEPLPADLLAPGPSPLPPPVRAQLSEMDPNFADYFDLQSRMRSGSRPGTLTERERGFASMSVDVHYQTLEDTFRIHTNRALRGGATQEDVRAVLRFNAQFGVTRAWHAWHALNTILAG